jgi:hypothetical protein
VYTIKIEKAYVDGRRRSFHDLETFKEVQVLSLERMVIDVEICGQLLIALRREEHLENVAACVKVRCQVTLRWIINLFWAVTGRIIVNREQAATGTL